MRILQRTLFVSLALSWSVLASGVLASAAPNARSTPAHKNAAMSSWIGMWGDGTNSQNSRTVVMISQRDKGLYVYAGETAANGSGIYKNQFQNQTPRGTVLQPATILRLQLISLHGGTPHMNYTREAYDGFAAASTLLHRLSTPPAAKVAADKTAPPDSKNVEPKNIDLKSDQPKTPDAVDKNGKDNVQEISATEGNMNQWLSNGIWKLRVTKVEKIESQFDPGRFGWGVTIEFTNVNNKKKTLSLFNTGGAGKPILADAGGEPMTIDEGDWQTGAYFKDVLPAQTRTWQIKYFYAHNEKSSEGPERLILEFDPKSGNLRDMGVKFNVDDPSFRVFLK